MSIRTLLACLTDEASTRILTEAASALAQRFDAHLIGQHTIEAIMVYPSIAMHIPSEAFAGFNAEQAKRAEANKSAFGEITDRWAVRAEWRMLRSEAMTTAESLTESARACDLILMTPPKEGNAREEERFVMERVIRDGGRPVLVLPDDGIGDGIGHRVVLGHARTREAARAAFDMLPLLEDGAEVHVVHVGDDMDEMQDASMTALSTSLSRHGHKVTLTHRVPHGQSVARVLDQVATEVGADLISTGAFGHSRTYDLFVGAVTRELLRDVEVPVLLSR